jgi:hypothetical protein
VVGCGSAWFPCPMLMRCVFCEVDLLSVLEAVRRCCSLPCSIFSSLLGGGSALVLLGPFVRSLSGCSGVVFGCFGYRICSRA